MDRQPGSALLVGGSSEIGLAIIEAVMPSGPGTVVLAGRAPAALAAACARLGARDLVTIPVSYDAAWSATQVREMVASIWNTTTIDLVVITVGTMGDPAHRSVSAGRHSSSEPDLDVLLQTNLVGPALVANEVADRLAEQGHGTLVIVTSAAAIRPRLQILGYAAAKQALDTFGRGLDARLRPHGARCTVVRPGQVSTRMTAHLTPAPMTTSPGHVGMRVATSMGARANVVWSPRAMGPAMALLRCLPRRLLPKSQR
ncbi:MAG: SDR family NAD(P)-dependent oxidoreductase [Pedococcus sp.]